MNLMNFRIRGLSPDQFRPYFDLSDTELQRKNIVVVYADDSKPGFPCRVSLADAMPGERLLLLNYAHLDCQSPYRSSHAIYVGENSHYAFDETNNIPDPISGRMLSIRAFDEQDMIIDADLVKGTDARALIDRLLSKTQTSYLHIHFAMRGCFAARVDRGN